MSISVLAQLPSISYTKSLSQPNKKRLTIVYHVGSHRTPRNNKRPWSGFALLIRNFPQSNQYLLIFLLKIFNLFTMAVTHFIGYCSPPLCVVSGFVFNFRFSIYFPSQYRCACCFFFCCRFFLWNKASVDSFGRLNCKQAEVINRRKQQIRQ